MSLQAKYKALTDAATAAGVSGLSIREENNVLYINGTANSEAVKDQLWQVYNQIDPDYRSGDLVMNVEVGGVVAGSKLRVATKSSNLNIRQSPSTEAAIVGKAAHGEIVTMVSDADNGWYVVKTDAGEQGYAYQDYLEKM